MVIAKYERFGLSWLTGKMERFKGAPWMRLESADGTWEARVIKTWQPGNEGQAFARWMMGTLSPHTGGSEEFGDGYILDVLTTTPYLVEVDGHTPTREEKIEWVQFAYNIGYARGVRRQQGWKE